MTVWPERREAAEPVAVYQKQSTFMGQGTNRGASAGQTSDEPLTFGTPAQSTVGSSAGSIAAAGTGTGRVVYVNVPSSAATGIYVNLNGTATSSHFLIEPGTSYVFPTEQAISAIRAGSSDVTVYVMIATVA